MMPISPRKTEVGFTLMEMLVVLTIMAIVAAVAMTRLPAAARIGRRERVAAEVVDALRAGHFRAMAEGREIAIPISGLLAKGADLALRANGSSEQLVFFPDGSASGGEVMLDNQPVARVDWLTGSTIRVR